MPTVQKRHRVRFHPLGEGIDCNQEEVITIGILRKWSCGINALSQKGGVDPLSIAVPQAQAEATGPSAAPHNGARSRSHPHAYLATQSAHGHYHIVPAISQVLVNVWQQLRLARQQWDAHPALLTVPGRRQKDF